MAFDEIMKAVETRASMTRSESRTLAALRDALLPKLISGELRVKVSRSRRMEVGLDSRGG